MDYNHSLHRESILNFQAHPRNFFGELWLMMITVPIVQWRLWFTLVWLTTLKITMVNNDQHNQYKAINPYGELSSTMTTYLVTMFHQGNDFSHVSAVTNDKHRRLAGPCDLDQSLRRSCCRATHLAISSRGASWRIRRYEKVPTNEWIDKVQRWEESEKRRQEKGRSKKRKSEDRRCRCAKR